MANFQNNAITENGILLRSHVDMGAVFTATKIVIGSGYIPAGKTAKTMTDVVSPVKELTINKKQRSPDGKVIFGGVYTNEGVATEFYFRELALYAKAVYPDGTEVAEVLYSYGNAAGSAELMAAYSTSTVVERQMDIVTFIGNDAEVDLTIESGVFMTREQVEALIAELGTASHAEAHAIGGEDPITPEMIGAEKTLGVVDTEDLFAWVDRQTTGGSFLIAPDMTTKNVPIVTWFIGHLDYNIGGKRITMTDLNNRKTWENTTKENVFTGWVEIANAKDYLRLDGSTSMNGVFAVNELIGQSLRKGYFLQWYGHTHLRNYSNDNNFTDIVIKPGDVTPAVVMNTDGVMVEYNLLHTGNAPAVVATAELV